MFVASCSKAVAAACEIRAACRAALSARERLSTTSSKRGLETEMDCPPLLDPDWVATKAEESAAASSCTELCPEPCAELFSLFEDITAVYSSAGVDGSV